MRVTAEKLTVAASGQTDLIDPTPKPAARSFFRRQRRGVMLQFMVV